jgi:hypothetical protein
MKTIALTTCILALVATSSIAKNSMKHAGFEVNPVNDVVYEAVSDGAHGGGAFWCAAGLFVESVLKASPKTEIYIVRGAGPSVTTNRRSAAQFTIEPEAAGVTPAPLSDNLNELNVGGHMHASLARNFCNG